MGDKEKIVRIVTRYLFLIILSFPLFVCPYASSEVHSMYEFGIEYLPLNEKIDYIITALESDMSGQAVITIKKIKQLDIDMFLIRYEGTEGETKKESWEVKLRMDDLTPVTFDMTAEDADKTSNYNGIFSGNNITITARATDQEPTEIILSKGSRFYLSMLVPYLLRNIEFETGDWFTFSVLLVDEGHFTTPIVQIKEREVVEVPAGMYDCWKVSIKIGNRQHWAWYSVKDPHYLIRYRYPDKELTMKRHS